MWVAEAQSDVVRRWARQLFLREAVWAGRVETTGGETVPRSSSLKK